MGETSLKIYIAWYNFYKTTLHRVKTFFIPLFARYTLNFIACGIV